MLEVCIDSLESAKNAVRGGADELEVCSSLTEGGLTPSPGLVKQIVEFVGQKTKINVMIRCRTGSDFNYSVDEMNTMLSDVEIFKEFGVNRFVFGALTDSQEIDIVNCQKIIDKAAPAAVTFHRAFDMCRDSAEAIDTICKLGFSRLLTSGQKPSVNETEAAKLIKWLVQNVGDKIEIMPGAGINSNNAKTFIDMGCSIVHSSCKTIRHLPKIENALSMGTSDSEHIFITDVNVVAELKRVIIKT